MKLTEYLSDKSKKENYDNFGHAAFENGGGGRGGFGGFSGADFSDIFEDFFGDFGGGNRRSSRKNSNNRGSDLRYDLSISLEEAFKAKNKIFNSQLLKNVVHVREMVQNLVIVQTDVLTVAGMEELEQIKVFLQFNKLVLNVLEVEKKLQIHVMTAMVKETNKLQKKYL